MDAANIEYSNINDLDSLNDEKTARNEPYLGLKMKASGAYIAGWLQANDVLRVKFGNLPAAIKVTINGVAAPDHAEGVFEYTAEADTYIKLATSSSSTVVLKQIMLNEAIADVELPEPTPTALENIEAAGKAVKVIVNGQLMIKKGNVLYNATGAIVK